MELIIGHLREKVSPKLLLAQEEDDKIVTVEFTIQGRIQGITLKAKSEKLGALELKVPDLQTILGGMERKLDFTVDAKSDDWIDTKFNVREGMRIEILAQGKVDIYPQEASRYMATPKGHNTRGKGDTYLAGCLVGRIGDKGKEFVVGELYSGDATEKGRLFVRIVASPWGNASMGEYKVCVNTTYKSSK